MTGRPVAESVARWLVDAEGLSAIAATTAALDRGRETLAVGADLRRSGMGPERAAAVTAAAAARRRARSRWLDADRLVFLPDMLEQASDPAVSAWRAERFIGAPLVWDLCSGAGGDTLALGRHCPVFALDRSVAKLVLLSHNSRIRGLHPATVAADVLQPPVAPKGSVHADPSRREGHRRLRGVGRYQPSVPALVDRWRPASGLAVVVSPAVDLHDRDLPQHGEVEFIQVDSDLTEAVCWLGDLQRRRDRSGMATTATLLPQRLQIHGPDRVPLRVGPLGGWLVEVAPAAVRARCHERLGAELGAWRVARTRALLTADDDPGPSPWWQRWRVEAELPLRPKRVRSWLRTAPAQPIEIAVHGVDVDAQQWWRALGQPPRGPQGRRLHLVRTDDGATCVATLAVDEGTVRVRTAETP